MGSDEMGVTWTAHYWIGVSFVLLVISVMVSELQIIGPHFIHWPNWKSKVVLQLVDLQFENRQLLFIFITYNTGHYKGDIGNSRLYCIVGSWLPQICINDKSNAIFSVSEKGHFNGFVWPILLDLGCCINRVGNPSWQHLAGDSSQLTKTLHVYI